LGQVCGGCPYHQFPYKAQPPILIDGKRDFITFTCKEDVWNVIDLLIEEVHENNKKGKEFDVSQSINAQLPFFTCRNHLSDIDIQKDINRYIYCSEFNIPPYKGSYGEQPSLWSQKAFVIKNAIAKKEKNLIEKTKKEKK
jgi:hypothetical protein